MLEMLDFVLKLMDYMLEMMDFVLKVMDYMLKMMDFELKMMDLYAENDGFSTGDLLISELLELEPHLRDLGAVAGGRLLYVQLARRRGANLGCTLYTYHGAKERG